MTKAERGFGRISANQCRRFITISLLGWVLSTAVLETLAQAQTATEVVLHNFGRKEGASPYGTPFRDPAGNLYGTTSTGGRNYAEVSIGWTRPATIASCTALRANPGEPSQWAV